LADFTILCLAGVLHNGWAEEATLRPKGRYMNSKVLAVMLAGALAAPAAQHEAVNRIAEAKTVFQEIMATEDKAIPHDLLREANCVVIVPGMKKGAFLVGAKYGKGVVMCRNANGAGWTGPATLRLEGGSVGFQIGGSETDLVLLVMNKKGADRLMESQFKIGGEAAVAAGPVGRQANASTDITMRAEMLGYSRARGVFGGLALEGSTIREDLEDNKEIYGARLKTAEIIRDGKGKQPAEGAELARLLTRYSAVEKK
jgi:lipid-binding SYLF domain-containing protein